MLPVLYNNNYQIVQTPDAVMILVEMVHDVRIIRINGTHPAASVRQWLGDSIGHWESDTLVVSLRGSSENLHVIERFKRVGAKRPIYEYACDKGKYALTNVLGGARKSDAAPGQQSQNTAH